MSYWRMQLHPDQSSEAIRHAIQSLAAGYIGLDFAGRAGDLMAVEKATLPEGQKDYWAFAHGITIDDVVLIIVHHYPFALVSVAGEYNYIRERAPEIGVWFRHFRRIKDVKYYADFETNPHNWERLVMTDTISTLREPSSMSYQLIERWLRSQNDER